MHKLAYHRGTTGTMVLPWVLRYYGTIDGYYWYCVVSMVLRYYGTIDGYYIVPDSTPGGNFLPVRPLGTMRFSMKCVSVTGLISRNPLDVDGTPSWQVWSRRKTSLVSVLATITISGCNIDYSTYLFHLYGVLRVCSE